MDWRIKHKSFLSATSAHFVDFIRRSDLPVSYEYWMAKVSFPATAPLTNLVIRWRAHFEHSSAFSFTIWIHSQNFWRKKIPWFWWWNMVSHPLCFLVKCPWFSWPCSPLLGPEAMELLDFSVALKKSLLHQQQMEVLWRFKPYHTRVFSVFFLV